MPRVYYSSTPSSSVGVDGGGGGNGETWRYFQAFIDGRQVKIPKLLHLKPIKKPNIIDNDYIELVKYAYIMKEFDLY